MMAGTLLFVLTLGWPLGLQQVPAHRAPRHSPAQSASAGDTFPRGEIVERVASRSDPSQSYALYLPSDYLPSRDWPVLLLMDPRGRALIPLRLFRSAAERHGYVVLSSYNTVSDSTMAPNESAVSAMLNDAQQLFLLDPRRLYLGGFSGTARIAWVFAHRLEGQVAGVIAFGAGLPSGWVLLGSLTGEPTQRPFAVFGGAGTTDFNYEEVRALDAALDRHDWPHRFEYFDARHAWPPEEVCARGLAWMEIQAVRTGTRSKDEGWVGKQFAERIAEVRSLEQSGDLYGAFVRYRAIAEDFAGLVDVSNARNKMEELANSKTVRRTMKRMRELASEWQDHEQRYQDHVETFNSAREPPRHETSLRRLRIESLRRRAEGSDDELDRHAARRMLEHIFVGASFYAPRTYLKEGQPERALAWLQIAEAISSGTPGVCYRRARANAQLGRTEEALKDLECALDAGIVDLEFIERDAYLEPIRQEPGYRRLVEELGRGA